MANVLTREQAKTIIHAIQSLTTIGAMFTELELNNRIRFLVYAYDGGYGISKNGTQVENYDTLHEFANAYHLSI